MKNKSLSILRRSLALGLGLIMLLSAFVMGVAAEEGEDPSVAENLALNKTVITNNAYSKAPGTNAVDGNSLTLWRTLTSFAGNEASLIVKFGESIDINAIFIKPYNADNMLFAGVQYTTDENPSDKSEWIDIETFETKDIKTSMTFRFDDLEATGVRFFAEVEKDTVGLYELQAFYSEEGTGAGSVSGIGYKAFEQSEAVDAKIVSVDENGGLVYADYNGQGGKLIDFSYVGYKRGEESIPDVKVVKTIEVGDLTDHTALIQGAIDEVSALPLEQRGAILLKAGKYTVSGTLKIAASGIVLRGEGQGKNGTIIYDSRTVQCTTLTVGGTASYSIIAATKKAVDADYVPAGSTTIKVTDAGVYKKGINVRIVCTPNTLWVQTLGMDVIPKSTSEQWKASEYVLTYERVVTDVDVENNTITIDTGLPLTLDSKYYTAYVQGIKDSKGRITESGVENMRFQAYYSGVDIDEEHPWSAIAISKCRDCFVRNVTSKYYGMSLVSVGSGSINVTVEACSYLQPVSIIEGGRRYSFNISGGQYTLIKDCYSYDSRHDYALNARVCGPNVFINCISDGSNNASEPHHRWSTGTLFDNIYQIGEQNLGYFMAANAGSNGTGHGWMAANTVFWNCLSPTVAVGKPQTEQNFAIGVYGLYPNSEALKTSQLNKRYSTKFVKPTIETPNYPKDQVFEGSSLHGTGYIESPYNPVNPSSLYRAQLSYRLYGDARKNVIPNSPILNYPATDAISEISSVTFSGVADFNASKVYVYVNGEKHQAEFATDGGNAYSLELNLENGYYDIYVTQEIDGIESSANATRTILVDSDVPYIEPEETQGGDESGATDTTTPQKGGIGAFFAAIVAWFKKLFSR